MYKELVEHKLSNRGKIVTSAEIKAAPAAFERYCSLYSYDKHILEYVKLHNSVTGFKGNYYAETLWFDIDDDSLELALSRTIELIKRLNSEYHVSPDEMWIYFSGSKGFHLALLGRMFGDFGSSPDMAAKHRALALQLAGDVKVDTTIYDNHRIFRIFNSLNAKSNLYKIEISFDELQKGIDFIKDLAKAPRIFERTKKANQILPNSFLISEWDNVNKISTEQNITEFELEKGFFKPPHKGERNAVLFKQAAMLFDKSELSQNAVYDILWSINHASGDAIDDRELRTLVSSASKKTVNNKTKEENLVVKTLGDMLPEWEDEMFSDKGTMTTCFSSFDLDLNFRLKGKVAAILGYGGTKKSLYALNIGLSNVLSDKRTAGICVYSSMEMNAAQNVSRVIDFIADDLTYNASYAIQRLGKRDINEAREILYKTIKPHIGNSLQFILNSRMTAERYDKVLQQLHDAGETVSMLIVDGLSMMGGKGREVEDYSINSSELKDLANKWNIFIPLICHLSKGGELHTRDTRRFVRGSEKILDNCDFIMMLSLVVDVFNSTGATTEYMNNKGYVRFYNKRGSGNTINRIFDFNSKKLMFTETDEDPKSYEHKMKEYSL